MSDIIGQMMMAMDPKIRPWDQVVKEGAQADTALIELANLRRQQEAQKLARQYYQQHPEALMGQGGGPVLASLQTAPGGPDRGGMSPQPGMPGQDPARYAGVSPQGGGPIPPDVARQVMPQVTPPGGMPGGPQSTLASLGPQPQANPLMDLVRRNPDAAFAVLQQQQQQQDAALKREEQRLTMGTKVAEYVGRVAQGVTSQETLEQARQELARIHPQAAAHLPQTYSKEAMVPYVKTAVSVKDNALLQLETWKNQIEEKKLGVQLAQAGYQGLGDDVTGIIRGLSEEQVKQFGGRTTPAAIAYATEEARKLKPVPGQSPDVTTELRAMNKDPWKAQAEDLQQARKNIEERELTRTKATEVQRGQTERELRGEKTVSETFGERTTKLYDLETLSPVNSRMKVKDYETMPTGRVKELSTNQTEIMENVNTAVPVITQIQANIDKIYGPGGELSRMTPEDRDVFMTWTNSTGSTALGAQFMQKYPVLTATQALIDSNAGALARALAGEKGAMAEGDVERAKAMLPNLKTSLSVWPPSNLGATMADTRGVALRKMNGIVDLVNGRIQTLLGNKDLKHPSLHRYQTAEEAPAHTGSPSPTGTQIAPEGTPAVRLNPNLPPVPGQPTPPATQPPAAAVPAPGPPIFPRPQIRIPGEEPAPALPTASTAQPTSQAAPAPAPAPATPTTRPTPGTQSQARPGRRAVELARAAGIKMMDSRDIRDAMEATGRSRAEVIKAARSKGYTVYSGGGTAMA